MTENLNTSDLRINNQVDTPATTAKSVENLEVKDAQVIFTNVWNELESEFGHENLRFSKELILLGGAPGSGKGTNTEFIMQARSDLRADRGKFSSQHSTGMSHQAGWWHGG